MRWDTDRIVGTMDVVDKVDGVELFAGVVMWAKVKEAGISMNNGRGGRAESMIFTDRASVWVVKQFMSMVRRNAYRRTRESAKPNFRPSPSRKRSVDQVKCIPCEGSGFVSEMSDLVTCRTCAGSGWMDPA